MTISNETKIGALTAIAITLLILGFNFLKGNSLSGKSTTYEAVFGDVQGLGVSNPVVINGKEVGNVALIDGGRTMRELKVKLNIREMIDIPDDSYAVITKSLLGGSQLEIKLGNSSVFLKDGAKIRSMATGDLIGDAMKKLDPVLYEVKNAVHSLDTMLTTFTSVLDPQSKNNIRAMLDNLNRTTASLAASSAQLESMMQAQTGAIAQTVENVNAITGNLKDNNEKISKTVGNLEIFTGKMSKLELEQTLATLNATMISLKATLDKTRGDSGTLGLLMNDTRLYNNLTATTNKLNLLLDDFRVHPKRYVNVSVFGKKDKTTPLTTPLPDTVHAPYLPH